MKVFMALMERFGHPVAGYWPELIAAVDEGTAEGNPDEQAVGFADAHARTDHRAES